MTIYCIYCSLISLKYAVPAKKVQLNPSPVQLLCASERAKEVTFTSIAMICHIGNRNWGCTRLS